MMRCIQDPIWFKRINGWLTVFWLFMVMVSMYMGWLSSVEFISALSIYAIVVGHLSTWQAARVEVRQERQENDANSDAANDDDDDD